MKIAHVISGLEEIEGGGTACLLALTYWELKLGHSCMIVTSREPDTEQRSQAVRELGGTVEAFERIGPKLLRITPGIGGWMKRHGHDFDVFVMHSSYQYPVVRTSMYCRHQGIPYIFTPHGSLDPSVRKKHVLRNKIIDITYHDTVLRGASSLHFTSHREMEKCERQIWKSCFVEPWGIDVDNIRLGPRTNMFRRQFGIPENAKLLLFLSRVTRKKGIEILLESFCRVAAKQPNLYLTLAGRIDTDMRGVVEAAKLQSTGSRIITPGFVTGEMKRAAYIDSDYFVLPTYSENFGHALFEALAYGLPTLTTTGIDLYEHLAKLERVRIIKPEREALYTAMADIIENNWQPATSVDDARKWLDDNFSWREAAKRIVAQYHKVIETAAKNRSAGSGPI